MRRTISSARNSGWFAALILCVDKINRSTRESNSFVELLTKNMTFYFCSLSLKAINFRSSFPGIDIVIFDFVLSLMKLLCFSLRIQWNRTEKRCPTDAVHCFIAANSVKTGNFPFVRFFWPVSLTIRVDLNVTLLSFHDSKNRHNFFINNYGAYVLS